MKQIGIIGAGIMASGMAQNFIKHGYKVHVWNRSAERLRPLVQAGVTPEEIPKAVAKASDIVIECVSDDDASRSVWLGEDGILAGASPKKVLITAASLSLEWTDELAKLCADKGFQFLDMPLTGSRPGAEGGTLKLLVGGEQAVLSQIQTDLYTIADKVYHFGPVGSGMRFKLLLNFMQAVQIDATSQAILLAQKAGLNVATMHDALFDAPMGAASPAVNMVFQALGNPALLNFAVKHIEKDLRYAQAMAKAAGVDSVLLNDLQADYAKAKENGLADRDWTAIIELFRREGK